MALLEAMYMKKVCIVSDVVGNRDVIHNKENGYVCSSIKQYIKKINMIITNKAILLPLVNKAQKNVISHYNSKIMAKQYEEIYKGSKHR